MLKAQLGKLRHRIIERHARAIAPAVHLDLAVTGGDVCHQQLAKAARCYLGKTRLGHQHGPQRNTARAIAGQLVDACERADAAAHVHGQTVDAADSLDRRRVGSACVLILAKGSGQIDNVHPACTLLGKRAGDGDGVVGIYLAAAAIAALQAHDLADEQIDCGEQDHRPASSTMLTKFLRMRCPSAEDFSGWNWQPHTLPWRTMHGKLRV